MTMLRVAVESSMARSVGYDPNTFTLEIEFHTGEVWQYQYVSAKMYAELMKGSIGKYFQTHIKGVCQETLVSRRP